jgi:hypothetical protein
MPDKPQPESYNSGGENYAFMKDFPDIDPPEGIKRHPFWDLLENEELKKGVIFLILNELRKYPPEKLTDAACRTQLAKLVGWAEILDLPTFVLHQKNPDDLSTDQESVIP